MNDFAELARHALELATWIARVRASIAIQGRLSECGVLFVEGGCSKTRKAAADLSCANFGTKQLLPLCARKEEPMTENKTETEDFETANIDAVGRPLKEEASSNEIDALFDDPDGSTDLDEDFDDLAEEDDDFLGSEDEDEDEEDDEETEIEDDEDEDEEEEDEELLAAMEEVEVLTRIETKLDQVMALLDRIYS